MVEPKDPTKPFDKSIACIGTWERRFPRLLTTKQVQELMRKGYPLAGISDTTCDIGDSIEFVNQSSSIDSPFFRYDPFNDSYHQDIDGHRLICSTVDIQPTEFAKEVSLTGHLFDQFLINKVLDIIEAAGGSFHLINCQLGQSTKAVSYSELEIGADDSTVLDKIIDSLSSIANPSENHGLVNGETNMISFKLGKIHNGDLEKEDAAKKKTVVLVLGAGRVCRPAVEFLASIGSGTSRLQLETCIPDDFKEKNDVQVIVASLYLRDAEEITEGIANATAVQLDIMDHESLCKYISQVEIVISLLPPRCHGIIANACIQLRKHLVTASYVDDSVSQLDGEANSAGITILGEMGLDPGIDHMMAMKIVNEAHEKGGIIKSFTSYCGGLPSPAAANNPLAYKFSWNPAGAILTGHNSATYRSHGERVHVDGNDLYRAAMKFRIPDLPAFAFECLPNRDSLTYGDLYGIGNEASTIFRGTLRYEGFSEIMETLARIGFFNAKPHRTLDFENRPTYVSFLLELLNTPNGNLAGKVMGENDVMEAILGLGLCQEQEIATKTAKTIIFLGLHEEIEVPVSCKSAFDVICLRMEERLAYSNTEQDMVLLHHEVEVEFPDGQPAKKHKATLLEFGRTENGKTTTAMASSVGIPAAIGALLLLADKIKTRGVLRPIKPEVYVPALEILQAYGIKLLEKMD